MRKEFSREEIVKILPSILESGKCPIIIGHTGFGKSAIFEKEIAEIYPDHKKVYLDAKLLKSGDLLIPFVENGKVKDGIREIIAACENEPSVIFIDEIFKAEKEILLELAEFLYKKRIGSKEFPNVKIFGASNLMEEDFGDTIPEFILDRIIILPMRKFSSEEFFPIAKKLDFHPAVQLFIKENPQAFEDFRDNTAGKNKFIFDPRLENQRGFVTARSLEFTSDLLKLADKSKLTPESLSIILPQKIGDLASETILTYYKNFNELPTTEEILRGEAKVPENIISQHLFLLKSPSKILELKNKKDIKTYLTFLEGFHRELLYAFYKDCLNRAQQDLLKEENFFKDLFEENFFTEIAKIVRGEEKNDR
jgi:hypothetical protein